jgi:hypothetical protein
MPERLYDCIVYADRALAEASQSTEPDRRAALIAQAQVSALQAVALEISRVGDRFADLVSVMEQAQRPG